MPTTTILPEGPKRPSLSAGPSPAQSLRLQEALLGRPAPGRTRAVGQGVKRASPAPPRAVPVPGEAGRRGGGLQRERPGGPPGAEAPPPATPAAQARAAGASAGGRGRARAENAGRAAYCFTLSPSASLRFFLAASSSLTKVAIAPSSRPDRTPGSRAAQPKNQRGADLAPEAQLAPARPAPPRPPTLGRRRLGCRLRPPARRSEGKGRSQVRGPLGAPAPPPGSRDPSARRGCSAACRAGASRAFREPPGPSPVTGAPYPPAPPTSHRNGSINFLFFLCFSFRRTPVI